MNPGLITQRFPLIARPRPPCTALPARITALAALVDRASRAGDLVAASRVFNQAAAYLADPAPQIDGQLVLEPLVNLARLHIRAGSGQDAVKLLDDLYQAVRNRQDTVINGVTVPAAALTNTSERHQDLSRWAWSVQLADGTRALTLAGRWDDAESRLRRHRGIGRRMLDGRQVAVIAHAIRGDYDAAQQLIADTQPGEPWEQAVTALLAVLARPALEPPTPSAHETMIHAYRALPGNSSLIVFHTRHALSILDSACTHSRLETASIARNLIDTVLKSADGYAARELLAHPGCTAVGGVAQIKGLTALVHRAGLPRRLRAHGRGRY
ncbi:hypothetical protein [Actinoplanes sp. NPDC051859]|uniref:hypothetical protein n=1 Tax=Actinoplanes sp. NPDC051859 TaxID=3363909 RepID=UPI0037A7BE7D